MARRKKEAEVPSNKRIIAIIIVVVLVLVALGVFYWYWFIHKGYTWEDLFGNPPKNEPLHAVVEDGTIQTDELSIHFLELGNKYTGDCTLIKVGNTEVLIDAGSKRNSADTICNYIDDFCTDGVLEYVIATHAHEDHIAGFVGNKGMQGVFDRFKCEIIIDFPLTDRTTDIYNDYLEKREAEVTTDGATHYTALECWKNENGAQRSYQLAENISMNILYQRFYEEKTSDENDYSVCMLLKQGDYNYLFTGDLEHDGEASLVESNDLPHCKLYKGGHHGSKTSSTDALLKEISPEMVCVCCCAGSPEYTKESDNTFPTQDFINRISQYTDQVFVTSLATGVNLAEKKWEDVVSMNGNIVVTSNGIFITLNCSNNNTILKETEWFKQNRTWPTEAGGE